jgi:hypothetical protein
MYIYLYVISSESPFSVSGFPGTGQPKMQCRSYSGLSYMAVLGQSNIARGHPGEDKQMLLLGGGVIESIYAFLKCRARPWV